MPVVRLAKRRGAGSWLALATKPPKLAAAALANGMRLSATDEEGGVLPSAGDRVDFRQKGFLGSGNACAGRRGQGWRESKGKWS